MVREDSSYPTEIITEEEWRKRSADSSEDTLRALVGILENPSKVRGMLSLNDIQTKNVKAIVAGLGAGTSSKYLSKYIGDELSAVVGAGIAAYLAKKLLG